MWSKSKVPKHQFRGWYVCLCGCIRQAMQLGCLGLEPSSRSDARLYLLLEAGVLHSGSAMSNIRPNNTLIRPILAP